MHSCALNLPSAHPMSYQLRDVGYTELLKANSERSVKSTRYGRLGSVSCCTVRINILLKEVAIASSRKRNERLRFIVNFNLEPKVKNAATRPRTTIARAVEVDGRWAPGCLATLPPPSIPEASYISEGTNERANVVKERGTLPPSNSNSIDQEVG